MDLDYAGDVDALIEDNQVKKSLWQRHRSLILTGASLVAVACVTMGIIAASGTFDHPSSNNSPSSSSSVNLQGFQGKSSNLAAHPIFSAIPQAEHKPGSEPGVVRTSAAFLYKDINNRLTQLEYDVEHREDIMRLEHEMEALGLQVKDDLIRVKTASPSDATALAARIPVKMVIPLIDDVWNTAERICETIAPAYTSGDIVEIPVKNISLTSVFKNAHVVARTGHNNQTETTSAIQKSENDSREKLKAPKRQRRGLFSFFDDLWDDVKDVADAIYDVGKLIITGQLVEPETDIRMWQFASGPKACLSSLSTDEAACGVQFNLDSIFELDIEDWELQSCKLAVEGGASLQINTDATVSESISGSGSDVVFNRKIWSGIIPVASFPIPISVYARLTLGFDWSLTDTVSVHSSIAASGNVTLGTQYDSYNGWNTINEHNFQSDATIHNFDSEVEASMAISVTPQIFLKAAYIGGPFAQVTLIANATATVQESNGNTNYNEGDSNGCNGLDVAVSGEVNVGVGAHIDISIDGHELFNKTWVTTVYKTPSEILDQKCFN